MTTDLEARLLEMRATLDARGVAITPRRAKLLEVLLASEHHPSAGDIHRELRRFFPKTSLATIYNTIEILKETGQVLEIEFSGAANRYDGRRPQSHPHLVCVQCDRIEDLDLPELDEPQHLIASATGYNLVGRRTDYYGVCPECQTENETQAQAVRLKGGFRPA